MPRTVEQLQQQYDEFIKHYNVPEVKEIIDGFLLNPGATYPHSSTVRNSGITYRIIPPHNSHFLDPLILIVIEKDKLSRYYLKRRESKSTFDGVTETPGKPRLDVIMRGENVLGSGVTGAVELTIAKIVCQPDKSIKPVFKPYQYVGKIYPNTRNGFLDLITEAKIAYQSNLELQTEGKPNNKLYKTHNLRWSGNLTYIPSQNDNNEFVLVMNYGGETLRDSLRRKLNANKRWQHTLGIFEAYAAQIPTAAVHRDLNPINIFHHRNPASPKKKKGQITIGDLGATHLPTILDNNNGPSPSYAAPEAFNFEAAYDTSSKNLTVRNKIDHIPQKSGDIFSLFAIASEIFGAHSRSLTFTRFKTDQENKDILSKMTHHNDIDEDRNLVAFYFYMAQQQPNMKNSPCIPHGLFTGVDYLEQSEKDALNKLIIEGLHVTPEQRPTLESAIQQLKELRVQWLQRQLNFKTEEVTRSQSYFNDVVIFLEDTANFVNQINLADSNANNSSSSSSSCPPTITALDFEELKIATIDAIKFMRAESNQNSPELSRIEEHWSNLEDLVSKNLLEIQSKRQINSALNNIEQLKQSVLEKIDTLIKEDLLLTIDDNDLRKFFASHYDQLEKALLHLECIEQFLLTGELPAHNILFSYQEIKRVIQNTENVIKHHRQRILAKLEVLESNKDCLNTMHDAFLVKENPADPNSPLMALPQYQGLAYELKCITKQLHQLPSYTTVPNEGMQLTAKDINNLNQLNQLSHPLITLVSQHPISFSHSPLQENDPLPDIITLVVESLFNHLKSQLENKLDQIAKLYNSLYYNPPAPESPQSQFDIYFAAREATYALHKEITTEIQNLLREESSQRNHSVADRSNLIHKYRKTLDYASDAHEVNQTLWQYHLLISSPSATSQSDSPPPTLATLNKEVDAFSNKYSDQWASAKNILTFAAAVFIGTVIPGILGAIATFYLLGTGGIAAAIVGACSSAALATKYGMWKQPKGVERILELRDAVVTEQSILSTTLKA